MESNTTLWTLASAQLAARPAYVRRNLWSMTVSYPAWVLVTLAFVVRPWARQPVERRSPPNLALILADVADVLLAPLINWAEFGFELASKPPAWVSLAHARDRRWKSRPQVCDRPHLARWLFSHIPLMIANQTAHHLLIALVSRDRVTLLSPTGFTSSSLYSCARQVSRSSTESDVTQFT